MLGKWIEYNIDDLGRLSSPKWSFVWKKSRQPLSPIPPPSFRIILLQFFCRYALIYINWQQNCWTGNDPPPFGHLPKVNQIYDQNLRQKYSEYNKFATKLCEVEITPPPFPSEFFKKIIYFGDDTCPLSNKGAASLTCSVVHSLCYGAPDWISLQNFCHRRDKSGHYPPYAFPIGVSSDLLFVWRTFHTGDNWMWWKMENGRVPLPRVASGFSPMWRTSHTVHTSFCFAWLQNESRQHVAA